MNPIKNHRGFTLVEIIFALAIGLVVMGALYMAMITGQRSSVGIEQRISAAQDIRGALEVMSMEIGMASYNPTFALPAAIWTGGPAINKGIQEVPGFPMDGAIQIQMDIRPENGSVSDPNESIIYIYNQNDQRITRNTGGGNQAFLGEAPGTQGRSVRVINGDPAVNIPVFRYFDGQGVDITGGLPGAIPNIRRIEIALVVETANVDPATQQRQRMVYTNGVILRNHAFTP